MCYVMFENLAGVLYRDSKHEAIAECYISDKARTARFFEQLKKHKPLNTLIRKETLKINVF